MRVANHGCVSDGTLEDRNAETRRLHPSQRLTAIAPSRCLARPSTDCSDCRRACCTNNNCFHRGCHPVCFVPFRCKTRAQELGITALHIKMRATGGNKTKTPGPGAQSALRALARAGMKVTLDLGIGLESISGRPAVAWLIRSPHGRLFVCFRLLSLVSVEKVHLLVGMRLFFRLCSSGVAAFAGIFFHVDVSCSPLRPRVV